MGGLTPRPTPGELAVAVTNQADRIQDLEDTISETRKTVSNVERMIVLMNDKLVAIGKRFEWTERLAFAAVVGIGGVVAQKIWELITRR